MSKKKDSFKPWLSRPAVNRSVTLPLTRPLTQRLSNLNEFHPNELDPYLLFDARDSMIGTLENPTLDLDPSKPDTLNVITATRSGTATYTDANGNIATAAADTVRVDHVDSVPMILVEPSATNLLPYSEDFSQSAWSKNYVTPTYDYGIAPDGANTSTRIQYTSGSAYITESFTTATYTASAFVKGVAGEVVKFGIGANVGQGAQFTLNGEWQRIQHTGTGGLMFFSSLGGNTATDFEIWGAQLEAGSVATSYIPTSGSTVTRQADDLVISGSDFTDFYNASEGTVYVESVPQDGINDFPYYLEFSNGSTGNRHYTYRAGASSHYYALNIGSQIFNTGIGSVTLDELNRISYSYKTDDYLGSSNGATPVPETGAVPTGISQLLIGNSTSSNPRLMTGRIKRLLYWPTHSSRL